MASISDLLDSLPRHFSGVASTFAATDDANDAAVALSTLVLAGSGVTDAASLDRWELLKAQLLLAVSLSCLPVS